MIQGSRASAQVLKTQKGIQGAGVLYHCFAGDVAHMNQVVDAGGYVSIPGVVTFKKANTQAVARSAREPPACWDHSPFCSGSSGDNRNEPCHVAEPKRSQTARSNHQQARRAHHTSAMRLFGLQIRRRKRRDQTSLPDWGRSCPPPLCESQTSAWCRFAHAGFLLCGRPWRGATADGIS